MATDSAAAAEGRAGITSGVELVVPWDAPEAVVDLHSDGVMDLDMVPDVIGLTGWWSGAAVSRILQGRDVRSVHVLVPDSRGLERDFHYVTIAHGAPAYGMAAAWIQCVRRPRNGSVIPGRVSSCGYVSLGLSPVVVVPGVLVHGVEGHATGLHGSCSGGT